ncbi:MAG: mechanosensitive ion channel [Candidatus Heimdallarchaeota archaeon]|nr:MAG: mechanosensitive ion channel [Candidatus Heimdallarchaeota archaeon]
MTITQDLIDDSLTKLLTDPLIVFGIYIIQVLFIIFCLWIIWGFLLNRVKSNISPELYNALRTLGRATLLLLGLFWIAGEELFIGAAALLGTAIGFASSTTIGNFISGLYLLVTNPFNVGDYIMLPDLKVEGIVEEISINYTKIITPQGVQVSINNQKMLGTTIHNTSIMVPVEAVNKGKITWRDKEGDKFDNIGDVVDILRGIRAKYADKEQEYYLYPLIYNVNPDKYKHSLTKGVLNEAAQKFSGRTVEQITWFLNDRSYNQSSYQINLIVINPYSIFDLTSDILGFLEEKIEEVHKGQ